MIDYKDFKLILLLRGYKSQRELAKRLGVRPWTLTRAKRRQTKNPQLLKKMERVLKLPAGSLSEAA
jgi:Trp operon repressor